MFWTLVSFCLSGEKLIQMAYGSAIRDGYGSSCPLHEESESYIMELKRLKPPTHGC